MPSDKLVRSSERGLLATQRYKELHDLTIAQQNAIELLIGGKTDKEVAGDLHIHRVTVTRWRLYHPGFQAELNARRALFWQVAQDRFRALTLAAMDAIAADLKAPDPARGKLALRVVELSGIRSENLGITGPSDPDIIVDEAIEADERREQRRALSGQTEARRREKRLELLALANEPADSNEDPVASP